MKAKPKRIRIREARTLVKKLTLVKSELAELLSLIPNDYKTKEVTFGRPVGKEAW